MPDNPLDPKGLIRESYRIDGITLAECRSIFLDWALSLPEGTDSRTALPKVHAQYASDNPGHPMTDVLSEGLHKMTAPRRRGGWKTRIRN